jgi:hypothetical protein
VKYDSQFVEFVVQEVLRRLAAAGWSAAPAQQPVAPPCRELVLTERLITLATVQGRLNEIERLVVPRRAVVSPSVRDELRVRRIELERRAESRESRAGPDT